MQTEAAARAELEALGASLVITSQYQYHPTIPAGYVISQSPAADTLVVPDETVILVVSLGQVSAIRFTGDNRSEMQAAVAAESTTASIVLATYVFLDIENEPIYANDSACTFRWGGTYYVPNEQEWTGVGHYGTIGSVVESLDIVAQQMPITIAGVDNDVLESAMSNKCTGRTAAVYLGLHNPRDLSLIDTPEEIWSGVMSTRLIKLGKNTGSITVQCEKTLRRLPLIRRYTDEDQRSRHTGDGFFQFTYQIPGFQAKWGSKTVGFGGGGNGRDRPGKRQPV